MSPNNFSNICTPTYYIFLIYKQVYSRTFKLIDKLKKNLNFLKN